MALSEDEGGFSLQKKEEWFEENLQAICPIFETSAGQ
jgi:hypothetical protein